MFHLTLRVAWHDNRWNGTICQEPSRNSFCIALDRIREGRDDKKEDALAGRHFNVLSSVEMPPCQNEAAAFMSDKEWRRTFVHPYKEIKKTAGTHGHLKPTTVKVPPYSTFAVPFAWMLRSNESEIDESLPEPLPADEPSPLDSAWVFGRERQEALLKLFFGRLTKAQSLVFFYCKEGQPLGDSISRLGVGIGRIVNIKPTQFYESNKDTYPIWDTIIEHSIRPDGADGFLLPYHDYFKITGDPDEDARRQELLSEIAVAVDPAHTRIFSYFAELATPGIALSTLRRSLDAIRLIRKHGISKGLWEEREEWVNSQIATVWKDRGAFPGLGSALEALGMRLGTAMSLDLVATEQISSEDNPWPAVDSILRDKQKPPLSAYEDDLKAVRRTWANLTEERRTLLELLSRFDLTPAQATRWFDPQKRAYATNCRISDSEIIANPYRIAETDLGDGYQGPVSIGVVDQGLLPESTIAARHPIAKPSAVGSSIDVRRVRAAIASILRQVANQGDALLSVTEVLERLSDLDLSRPCTVGVDWIEANSTLLEGVIELFDVPSKGDDEQPIAVLQLSEIKDREERLRKILRSRAEREIGSLRMKWSELITEVIQRILASFDSTNPRHKEALKEQARALERITTRKLSALVGRAGTGKTSVLGALLLCKPLIRDGILLLAPTGKARVRLGRATEAEAMTIAQFLYRQERYDGQRQRPLFSGKEKYRKEKTVIIDECSMLTMDDLLAVLEALDLAHVQRLILVGDPNQLPPIGVGRPFADFVADVEQAEQSKEPDRQHLVKALGKLTTEVRAAVGAPSDTLRLASWFTREPQSVDADSVLSDLELGEEFNDLEICFWKTPEELREQLMNQFQKYLGLENTSDVQAFNRALGIDEKGWVPFNSPNGAENFQILSPVRMNAYGVHEINRRVQRRFRQEELRAARQPWGISLGDEGIVVRDKVIQIWNGRRKGFDGKNKVDIYLANGEIGLVAPGGKGGFLNVIFAGRPGISVGYSSRDFLGGEGPLELAYALTVHKSQGSEFSKVFVIIPKNCRLISRELLYTALTRSRDRLVLLIEGDTAGLLYNFTLPEKSETARRNTNLFQTAVRERADLIPYADHLIHRTEKGHMVRSKSEIVIANMLYRMDIPYEYERRLEGEIVPGIKRPDFSFVDPAGDLMLWEHLGMLAHEDYRREWERKKVWYEKNGFISGKNLFTSEEDEKGALDSLSIRKTAETIKRLI